MAPNSSEVRTFEKSSSRHHALLLWSLFQRWTAAKLCLKMLYTGSDAMAGLVTPNIFKWLFLNKLCNICFVKTGCICEYSIRKVKRSRTMYSIQVNLKASMQWRSKFSLNLWATTFLLKQWTLDELMIGLSSGHHGRHQNIPASKMNFFSLKEFFLLSFLFRNCVSLNPLLWLCFKNCFC